MCHKRGQDSTKTPPKTLPRHHSDGQATKNGSKIEPQRDQKTAPKHAQHKKCKMSPNHIFYHVLYTSGHPWDHQFSTILGTKMQSKRWSKQICQKSLGKWPQSSTRSAQSSAKVAQKPPRWIQDGVRKPVKIDKKVAFEVVCGFGRHSGVTLVLWGCPWDAAWLPNPAKSHHDATQEHAFRNSRSAISR